MTLALYIDEHIPIAISDGLKLRGIDVLTVRDDGRAGAADIDNLRRAFELRRVMVTEDHDFERLANEFWVSSEGFYGIAFILRQGVSFGVLIDHLELLVTGSEVDEVINRLIYIPMR